MRSICLMGVQVAVEREGWIIFPIDKYDMVYFERKGCVLRNLYLNWCNKCSTGRSCSKAF